MNEYLSDHRSYEHYLSSSERKAWKTLVNTVALGTNYAKNNWTSLLSQ